MAAYIQVPRDLSNVKTKVFLNLTKRQILCFSAAASIGIPSFFLFKLSGNNSLAMLGMMFVMMPFFLLAMYEKDGQPLEVVLGHFVDAKIIRPKVRPYKTNNYYSVLERTVKAQKEVKQIVESVSEETKERNHSSKESDKGRKKRNQRSHRAGKAG